MDKIWTRNAEAIVWVTMATALFSVIFASGKFAGETASVFQVNFLRHIGGSVTLAVIVAIRGEALRNYRSQRPLAHFLRAVFGVVGAVAIIQASADMPIVDATAMSLLYVVFVIILGMLVFRERIGIRQWSGIVICVGGALAIMLSRGAFRQFDPGYIGPALLAIFGAVLFAFEGVMIKLLASADRPMTVLLYVNVFGIVLLALPTFFAWKSLPLAEVAGYLLLGPLGIVAQYCIIRGYRMADISVVGPVDYSWLIFASLIGFFFFNELPTAGVVIGSVLIATGGVVLATVKPAGEAIPVEETR